MAMRASRPDTVADTVCQLELFDDALAEPERARAELAVGKDRLRRSNASLEVVPIEPAEPGEPADGGSQAGADRATLAALETALADARAAADDRPALVVLASRFGELGTQPARPPAGALSLRQARDDWLRRLEASQKSESAIVAYRVAIDDLLGGAEAQGGASSRRRRSSTICARTGSGRAPRAVDVLPALRPPTQVPALGQQPPRPPGSVP
jgi:hypothetical protein